MASGVRHDARTGGPGWVSTIGRSSDRLVELSWSQWLCAWTPARGHARSGDAIAIASYLGSSDVFARAIAAFAMACADQNERDHAALVDAIAIGGVQADAER
jgi:hypothetical protein